jgi:hypothetical protein
MFRISRNTANVIAYFLVIDAREMLGFIVTVNDVITHIKSDHLVLFFIDHIAENNRIPLLSYSKAIS